MWGRQGQRDATSEICHSSISPHKRMGQILGLTVLFLRIQFSQ